ncbi:MAG: hypothetical protein LBT51_09050 [Fusobacteriaceae bacterium]|jgi:hypothetical protein|nr:hypothetical protein [Fusobacteriaceae bacterium]
MIDSKQKYIKFCETEKNIPIFSQAWWLDIVCGEGNWDVILVKKGDSIVASFPYYLRKGKFGTKIMGMPRFTQKLGPYICYPAGQKYSSRLSYEKEIMNDIIKQLPKFDFFNVRFDYKYQNWLPFYWNGFKQTTLYTYVIGDISNNETVFSNFDYSKRSHLKKALINVNVHFDLSCDEFYNNHKMVLRKQGKTISYSYELFKQMYEKSYEKEQGRTIYCKDNDGNINAAFFVVWDNYSAYHLITSIDNSSKKSGVSLLVYKIIEYLSSKVTVYDFEGSMIEGVENSFREYGTIQKPYFDVYKYGTKKYIILENLRNILNAFKS